MEEALNVVPLGGIGEFGMNCTVLHYGEDMIIVDAGLGFPSTDEGGTLGVDIVVPDISFLKENREKIRAILLSHGHEDHTGAVSYIINEINVPVYGNRLALGLVFERLKERNLAAQADLRPIEGRQVLQIGAFQVEPLHVTHSFPDAFCFAISCPVGTIIWSGDFKFDQNPIDRRPTDMTRLSEYGEKGVLALFGDSTNSDVPGLSPSESSVYDPLRNLFRRAEKKIIVSCFASSISRIQVILDLAREFHRKVAPVGRSMIGNIRAATELGYLKVPEGVLINAGDVQHCPANEVLVLATGSQGEPMAALSRLAINEFKNIEIGPGDLVILSARIIPGNERLISNLINHFYRRGAQVFDANHAMVHVSGHGYQDDLKLMINLTRPRFFIPIHGEYRQLKSNQLLALAQGIPPERLLIIENGDVLRLTADSAELAERVTVGRRFIEEGHREEVHDLVLKDRRYLSEDGFVVVILRVDRFSGDLLGEPELVSRGFVMTELAEPLLAATREEILRVLHETPAEEKKDVELLKEIVRKEMRRFLRKQTGKRPIIVPVPLEI
jgi:ribonuclease J